MVRLGRILRDYRDAGSVNGLLALWGFVDDTTFLTKAGHVGVVYRVRGVDYEGLSHPQRQALAHRFEAGLRLLDEHCRVYQYLLKRTVAPFVAGTCDQPIANEAIQRRAAYLNGRRHDLYDLSLYLVLLYEAPHVVQTQHRACAACGQAPREALRAWLSTDRHAAAPRIGARSSRRDAAPQGAGVRGPARRLRPCAPAEARGLPVLPRARELRRRPSWTPPGSRTTRTWTTSSRTPPSTATATTCWSATASSRCSR